MGRQGTCSKRFISTNMIHAAPPWTHRGLQRRKSAFERDLDEPPSLGVGRGHSSRPEVDLERSMQQTGRAQLCVSLSPHLGELFEGDALVYVLVVPQLFRDGCLAALRPVHGVVVT